MGMFNKAITDHDCVLFLEILYLMIFVTLVKIYAANQEIVHSFFLTEWSVKLTAHGVQPHEAAYVVVKVQAPTVIAVSASYHLV